MSNVIEGASRTLHVSVVAGRDQRRGVVGRVYMDPYGPGLAVRRRIAYQMVHGDALARAAAVELAWMRDVLIAGRAALDRPACEACGFPTSRACDRCGRWICEVCAADHFDSADTFTRKPCRPEEHPDAVADAAAGRVRPDDAPLQDQQPDVPPAPDSVRRVARTRAWSAVVDAALLAVPREGDPRSSAGQRADEHPDDNAVSAFVAGRCAPAERATLERHLDGCLTCLELVASAASVTGGSEVHHA